MHLRLQIRVCFRANSDKGRWLEFLSDYDFDIHYHTDKANKVADALSPKSAGSLMSLRNLLKQLKKEIVDFELQLVNKRLATLHVQPLLLSQIKEEQQNDENFSEIIYEVQKEKREDFTLAEDGMLMVG